MHTFVRAVITGFGFSLGKTLFEKVKERVLPSEAKSSEAVEAEDIVEPEPTD